MDVPFTSQRITRPPNIAYNNSVLASLSSHTIANAISNFVIGIHPLTIYKPTSFKATTTKTTSIMKISVAIVYAILGGAIQTQAKALRGKHSVTNKCITQDQVVTRIQSFADAVPAISEAYWKNGGGPAGSETLRACQAAYDGAMGALAAAYGYDGTVLFKPTLSTQPYTFRPTRAGALSYFIGTACLNLAGSPEDQFPAGNGDGSIFQENGFALNNYVGSDGVQRTGWTATKWDSDEFFYRVDPDGGQNCDTAVAQGRMCFVQNTSGLKDSCVDKTFGFNECEADSTSGCTAGEVVFTTHHSSGSVSDTASLVICQNEGEGPNCS